MHKKFVELFDIVELPNPKHEFKPFDKVLVRDRRDEPWKCDFYSHKQGKLFICIGSPC